jgi:hypothetical protein
LAFLVEFGLAHLRPDPNKNLQNMIYDVKDATLGHINAWVSESDGSQINLFT